MLEYNHMMILTLSVFRQINFQPYHHSSAIW